MLKQLYKRKMPTLFTATLLAIMSFSLSGCSDDVTEERLAVIEDKTPEVSSPEASVVEQTTAETVTQAATQGKSDAGFLDYDMVIGDPNAPVEMIEYASLTCNHCATFHTQVLPLVKEKYVDTGKVKIVIRSFLLNGIDAQATVLTRCVPESRYFTFMDALFTRQTSWYDVGEYQRLAGEHDQQTAGEMFVAHVMGEVEKLARQVGLNKNKIDACFNNQAIGEYIFAVQQDGIAKYNINATPTIVVNGKVAGNSYGAVEQAIEAALELLKATEKG